MLFTAIEPLACQQRFLPRQMQPARRAANHRLWQWSGVAARSRVTARSALQPLPPDVGDYGEQYEKEDPTPYTRPSRTSSTNRLPT
jgi:hypothetical protein